MSEVKKQYCGAYSVVATLEWDLQENSTRGPCYFYPTGWSVRVEDGGLYLFSFSFLFILFFSILFFLS